MTLNPYAAEFVEVSKTYRPAWRLGRPVEALRGVSLAVERGESFGLLGPNRAGKTTLLKVLLGLCRPTGGRVTRLGRPLADRGALARVGYVHERQAFPGYHTAAGLLGFYGALSGMSPAALRARVPAVLALTGLADRDREPIARFSKGMVQRLALAQAVLGGPDLLVLDEPTEGLDLEARQVLREVVAAQRAEGKAVLVVSHALGEVARCCDRVAVLVAGRLCHVGPLAALLRDPDTGRERPLEDALRPLYLS